ncbi:unnamed protein product [Cylindrotheca closterium]|uniref:SnoaL-like domain-containing protein n=1 Tax=Cylindrotheca closterium TaxID=2856 RepID=A0AAD2GBJ5_9STRA|nr:unnamed protein product [Cylindrotheca closterium]
MRVAIACLVPGALAFQTSTGQHSLSRTTLQRTPPPHPHRRLHAFANPFEAPSFPLPNLLKLSSSANTLAEKFIAALNEKRIDDAMMLVGEDVKFIDTDFPSPFEGKEELEKVLRLASSPTSVASKFIIDDVAVDKNKNKVGVQFHMETDGQRGKIGNAFFKLGESSGLIEEVFVFREHAKSGETNLKILRGASQIIALTQDKTAEIKTTAASSSAVSGSLSPPEQYFQAWNERDIDRACSVFVDHVKYDDTQFPAPFMGREKLNAHLTTCSECMLPSMSFEVDDTIDGGDKFMTRWHVDNNGDAMPFSRGCSFYNIKGGKIITGVDVVEPAVFKLGGVSLLANKVLSEPIRLVPAAAWLVYMYVVFFSDWFFGLPATSLEQRTWEEVRDLSLNFFFVSPILHLPFAPVVHPMLEGVFNLLLSWAAMFAGFLSDERKEKPNPLPMLPIVIGMQFLTSAFLLPFLATRSNEEESPLVYQEDLSIVAKATESPILGIAMGGVGTGAIFWALFARIQDFGWDTRLQSFLDLLSIDRVGSSFLVDLAIFAAFQGWLVDDDLKRRNMDPDALLGKICKFVPFFGMAAYLTLRDPLPQNGMRELEE